MILELKRKWRNYCVLSAAGAYNVNANFNNIIFYIKDKILYVPVVALSARDNKKLSKLFSKGFQRSFYWNEYKRKRENKNTTNECRYFTQTNFVGFNRLFVLVCTNDDNNAKKFKVTTFYLPKDIKINYNAIINGIKLLWQPIDSEIKLYEEVRKLTTG